MTATQAVERVAAIARLSTGPADMSITLHLADREEVAAALDMIEWQRHTRYLADSCEADGRAWMQGGGMFGGVWFLLASPHLPIACDASAEVAQ